MEPIDIDELTVLLDLLISRNVTEFAKGDLRITVQPKTLVVGRADSAEVTASGDPNPRRDRYEKLFNGRVPSFEDFKQAGFVTEER